MMSIFDILEILLIFSGLYFLLIFFPWLSLIFLKEENKMIQDEISDIEEEEIEYSYIIYLGGQNSKFNSEIDEKLSKELSKRGIIGIGNLQDLNEKIKKFDNEINIKKIRKSYSNRAFQKTIDSSNLRLKLYPEEKELYIHLIRSFYNLENFYQCINACDELIKIEEDNLIALRFLARSNGKLENFEEEKNYYEKISQIDLDDLDSRSKILRYYYKFKEFEKAVEMGEEILLIEKDNEQAQRIIAKSNLILGNKEKTLKNLLEIYENDKTNIESIFSVVNFYFSERKYESSIEWCKKIIRIDSEHLKTWHILSRCYSYFGNNENLEECLLKIINLDDKELENYIILARFYYSNKNYENCIKICEDLLQIDENYLEAIRIKARSKEKLGVGKVIDEYLEIAVLNKVDVGSRLRIMKYYYNNKEYENCIEVAEEIILIQGENSELLHILCRAYFNLGKNKEAREFASKYLKNNSQDKKILLLLIKSCFNSKEYEETIQHCEEYLQIDQSNIIVKRLLSRSQNFLGNHEIAAKILNEIIKKDVKDIESRITLIRNYYNLGNFERVHTLCDQILTRKKTNRIALLFHARAYNASKDYEKALEAWENVLKIYKNDSEALGGLGRVYYNLGNIELAKEFLEKALEISPDSSKIQRTLSLVYIKQKNWEKALPILKSECRLNPLNLVNWERKINLYYETNREKDALNCLEEVFEYIPDISDAQFIAFAISKSYFWNERADLYYRNTKKYFDKNGSGDLIFKFIEFFYKQGNLSQTFKFINLGLEKEPSNKKIIEFKSDFDQLVNKLELSSEYLEKTLQQGKDIFIIEEVIKNIVEKSNKIVNSNWVNNNKLAMISSSLNRGGAERQVVSCLEGLVKSKKFSKTTLFCHAIDNSGGVRQTYEDEIKNIKIPIIEYSKIIDYSTIIPNANELLEKWDPLLNYLHPRIRKEIETMFLNFSKFKPSIVHTWQDTTNIFTGLAAAMAGVPKVLMFGRSLRPDQKTILHMRNKQYLKEAYRTLINSGRFTLCLNSKAGAKSYSEWLEIPIEKISVLYNGTDFSGINDICKGKSITERLNQFNINKNDKVVGTVFRFVSEKRPLLWLEVAKQVLIEKPNVKFILVGDGALFNTVKFEIEKENLSDNVHLVGQTNLVKLWLDRMDIFLMTSKTEGLPNVLIEAQGFGVPVISTNAGGASETFIEGETGFLINNSEAHDIAEKILDSLFDENWLKLASEKSFENARAKFDKHSMFKNLSNLYDNL